MDLELRTFIFRITGKILIVTHIDVIDMEEKVIHGPEKMGPKITAVKALENWKLWLAFENGERRIFNMKPYRYGVFARLEEVDYFERVRFSQWIHLLAAWTRFALRYALQKQQSAGPKIIR